MCNAEDDGLCAIFTANRRAHRITSELLPGLNFKRPPTGRLPAGTMVAATDDCLEELCEALMQAELTVALLEQWPRYH